MNKNNFVNVVGFQLEKVHTGAIRWLIETEINSIDMKDKYTILERMYTFSGNKIDFGINDISNIKCIPEYSFGRNTKIDLVIEISLKTNEKRFLVIEMKVDSIPEEEQLKRTYSKFEEKFQGKGIYFLFLLGSSQVSLIPKNNHSFNMCKLDDIINIFKNLNCSECIYKGWIEALHEEVDRKDNVITYLNSATKTYNEYFWDKKHWISLGYRTWFPLLYYIYNKLRCELYNDKTWNIYSGSNNPVMNWEEGWLNKKINGYEIQFYWEFNYEKLLLKVYLDEENRMPKDLFDEFRDRLYLICKKTIRIGSSTQKRYGKYNSIYKWNFNFKEETMKEIAETTDIIIDQIHRELTKL